MAIAILVVLAVFIWPTRYKYDQIKMGHPAYEAPVRIDRFTGKTEILFPEGWRTTDDGGNRAKAQPQSKQELPAEEIAELTGQGQITADGWVEIEVSNGSNWTLSEVTVLVTVSNAHNMQILSRPYQLLPEVYGDHPQSSTKFHASLGFELAQGQTWSFSITGAKGFPATTKN